MAIDKMAIEMVEVSDTKYVGPNGMVMARESEGFTPNGNPVADRWVLRQNGEFIDIDQYRFDMEGRHGLKLLF